jgi:hypothetical protein
MSANPNGTREAFEQWATQCGLEAVRALKDQA